MGLQGKLPPGEALSSQPLGHQSKTTKPLLPNKHTITLFLAQKHLYTHTHTDRQTDRQTHICHALCKISINVPSPSPSVRREKVIHVAAFPSNNHIKVLHQKSSNTNYLQKKQADFETNLLVLPWHKI